MAAGWEHTSTAQQVVAGEGALRRLSDLLRALGARRAMLVASSGRLSAPEGTAVRRALGSALTSTFDGVAAHNPAPSVQAALRQARTDGVDAVVSLGGGAAVDCAKAVAFFTEVEAGTPSTAWIDRPTLPHVAVPTTYAGAAYTATFATTDPTTRSKQVGGGPTTVPRAVVADPALTVDLPGEVSAASGVNALAHAVEAALSPRRTPEAEALALAAIGRLRRTLALVVDDPGDVAVRTAVMEGAVLAGRSLANSAVGAHHGLCQLLGGRTGVDHGRLHAVVLAPVLRLDAERAPDRVARVAEALGAPDDPAGAVAALCRSLGLPSGLGELGVSLEDLDAVAALAAGHPSVAANVVPLDADDVGALLAAAY